MREQITEIQQQFDVDVTNVVNRKTLDDLRVKYLRKKGPVQDLMHGLRDVDSTERPAAGKAINDLKEHIESSCSALEDKILVKEDEKRFQDESIDVTIPGRKRFIGRKHPITQLLDQVISILSGMGFSVQYGPDIEKDYYNFEALNFPKDHPARDMQDTFYIAPDVLLRTHTSNTQVRVMEANKPPIRIIAPGKCYRNEAISARSHVFFHQVEGLYIDKGVTFSDLLSTLEEFYKKLFAEYTIEVRMRASYFPFVEPGMEVDVTCLVCGGKGCAVCKKTGWLEVSGAGMVHPEVLLFGGIDPEEYTGYAWGMGIERLFMIKHGIKDIRLFYENDMRFLEQFT